ncbi:MAG: hypothetical protein QM682_13855 [Paracoccus sp. (in: a-proteobacteria)]|uniref:hypothetical protein n=1 Tax=Paracoccus sp. TaxID=267 RepID=UPI0039E39AD3
MTTPELALQALAPSNVLARDKTGAPSVMVRIPRFRICDVIEGGSDDIHPAFIVNGKPVPEIWISKFQNVVRDGLAYSLPDQPPGVHIDFEQARAACEAKGEGWHLMTAAEWAAIALWCRRNGYMPRGNNDFGKDWRETVRQAAPATYEAHEDEFGRPAQREVGWGEGGDVAAVRTGTGPVTWSHNGAIDGIWDLNGNVAEWLGGCRLMDGEINIIADNDAAGHVDQSPTSPLWRAVGPGGELVAPGAPGSLKLDYLDDRVTLVQAIAEPSEATRGNTFETARTAPGLTAPERLTALALFPADDGDHALNYFYVKTLGERICMRGSHWNRQSRCGVFALYLCPARDLSAFMMGFRAAYIPPAAN